MVSALIANIASNGYTILYQGLIQHKTIYTIIINLDSKNNP